jgi:hypothetical protein
MVVKEVKFGFEEMVVELKIFSRSVAEVSELFDELVCCNAVVFLKPSEVVESIIEFELCTATKLDTITGFITLHNLTLNPLINTIIKQISLVKNFILKTQFGTFQLTKNQCQFLESATFYKKKKENYSLIG